MNSCVERSETPRSPLVQLIPAVSRPAPSWSAVAIIDLKMQELSSQHFAGKYLVLLFYPCDFSFVCPTELIQFSDRIAEFRVLGTKLQFSPPVINDVNRYNFQLRRTLVKEKDSSNKRLENVLDYFIFKLRLLCSVEFLCLWQFFFNDNFLLYFIRC